MKGLIRLPLNNIIHAVTISSLHFSEMACTHSDKCDVKSVQEVNQYNGLYDGFENK